MNYVAICRALSFLRTITRRVRLLDRILQIECTDSEFSGINAAYASDGRRIGDFYYWKAVNTVLLLRMKQLDARGIRALISTLARPAFEPPALEPGRGIIFSIPHHGHFVMSIISIAERISIDRDVYVFYDSPESHASNALFDVLHEKIFMARASRVHIIHNDRRGLATALKALGSGAALIILPDVYKNVTDTFVFPFYGKQWNAMIGTATLARRTNAIVYPVVSRPRRCLYEFETILSSPIAPDQEDISILDTNATYLDYRTTLKMFMAFEKLMQSNLAFWQYASTLFANTKSFAYLDARTIKAHENLFLSDPRLCVETTGAITLDHANCLA